MSIKYKFRNPEGCYFVTYAIVDWIDVFTRNTYKDILIESWRYYQRQKGRQGTSHPGLRPAHKTCASTTILLFLICISTVGFSQPIPQQMQIYVEQLHASQQASVPEIFSDQKNTKELIESAVNYFDDTLVHVRRRMYSLVGEAGVRSQDKTIRSYSVDQLVKAIADYNNVDLLLTQFNRFTSNDFSGSAKDSLISLFRQRPPYLDQLARLVGSLQITSLKDDLMVLSGPTTSNQRIRWAALLALARMGDKEATQSVMKRVQRLPVNDDIVYEVFPDLVYTRQRSAIDYLIVELKSDEKKCFTADAEDETPITCAYRIMEMLAPVIEKYPLELDPSGDIKTKDYKKSLAIVRAWFERNKDYGIVQEN